MLTLNLVNEDYSDIGYVISKYPDGQQSIALGGFEVKDIDGTVEVIPCSCEDMSNRKVIIKSRLNTFQHLELIICATKALRNLGVEHIELYTPYLIGARSDRKFDLGGVNYLKDVISPIINSMGYKKVHIHTPHSDVTEACINNFVKIDNNEFVRTVVTQYICKNHNIKFSDIRLLSPDAGALKRVFADAEHMNYTNEIIIAAKHRNPKTGQITHTSVPMSTVDVDKHIVMIDDICDGGRTFIEIAKAINEVRALSSAVRPDNYGKIFLIVTHGIFSSGFKELNKYFDGIYCTDSYSSMNDPEFSLVNDNQLHKLTQTSLFL
jgi:ribose-phosphate pyrophosphokinase